MERRAIGCERVADPLAAAATLLSSEGEQKAHQEFEVGQAEGGEAGFAGHRVYLCGSAT